MLDEGTDMIWSEFLKKKSDNCEKVYKHIMKMRGWGIDINKLIIRCDNAPENYKLKERTEKEGLGIKFEFTARGTPQQNGKLERKLRTLWSRTRAMMNGANLQGEMRGNLWAEAVRTSTMIDTVLTPSNEKSSYEKFHKMKPTFMNKPRIFGEIGILKKNKKIFSKLENKGTSCMFVGYSEDHPADTYRLYVLDTKKVVIARDVQWLDTTINQNRRMMIDNRGIDTSKWIEEEIDLDDAKVDEKRLDLQHHKT